MRVKFLKRRFYDGKLYEINDIISMPRKHAKAFMNAGAVSPALNLSKQSKEFDIIAEAEQFEAEDEPEQVKESIDCKDLSYRELQKKLSERGLPAKGTRDELIRRFKEGDS